MIVNNIFGRKIETPKLELVTTIEMKLDDIKDKQMKNIDSLEIKVSDITLKKYYFIL